MDIKVTDGNNSSSYTIQQKEFEEIIKYAECWVNISNDKKQNELVQENINNFKSCIKRWSK